MLTTVLQVVVLLALLALIPVIWPHGFTEPPLVMLGLLAVAAVVAAIVGARRRRARGEAPEA